MATTGSKIQTQSMVAEMLGLPPDDPVLTMASACSDDTDSSLQHSPTDSNGAAAAVDGTALLDQAVAARAALADTVVAANIPARVTEQRDHVRTAGTGTETP
eukprot:m.207359 g.207359  ORF g.207359 m.207359 type:complete len:102 (+) comp23709_c0_seq1:193-498(+)